MPNLSRDEFTDLVRRERAATPSRTLCIPLCVRLLADQLTPVVAYRRLVAPDERTAPSFLLESVEGGERQGRYSVLGARPHSMHTAGDNAAGNPFAELQSLVRDRRLIDAPGTPGAFVGGLVGYAAYDSVRYTEPAKLPFSAAPPDDRRLPVLCFGFYTGVVVFDHVEKTVYVVELAQVSPGDHPEKAYDQALVRLHERLAMLDRHTEPLRSGEMPRPTPPRPLPSNLSREQHAGIVARAKEFIAAGDIFQVVLGQRFERTAAVDPFDVYRALRAVNPSPYMVYMQCEGCILIASSPEILCRVRAAPPDLDGTPRFLVTNRPLAGTRRRGRSTDEDAALERELLADAKERAEHIMLVDLGRNDVGRVASPGSIALPRVMEVERYSHVMHISSTVTGLLRDGLDCWDALRAALPVGTISGAPKIRAMQIIDELEPLRRGPYGGGIGYVGLDGQMDIALTLRTIVAPTALRTADRWTYHLQASGGIVADSNPADEYQETVNKAAALARAIEVAEQAFGTP